MNKISILFLSLLCTLGNLSVAVTGSADPRMETNKNFCHFILDPEQTDNEVFVAGCDSVITVIDKTESTSDGRIQCATENYNANGYASIKKIVPLAAAPLPSGSSVFFTSDASDTPCTMVESNGRAYTSKTWQSTIKVDPSKKGFVTVQYELICQDGRQ